jgi:hypothetical protein
MKRGREAETDCKPWDGGKKTKELMGATRQQGNRTRLGETGSEMCLKLRERAGGK